MASLLPSSKLVLITHTFRCSRARKIRCDSTRPVCNNCVRRSNECQYDAVPKRRGPDKRPGTRQRSCKKRPPDGSAPSPPSKRKRIATDNRVHQVEQSTFRSRESASPKRAPASIKTIDCPEYTHTLTHNSPSPIPYSRTSNSQDLVLKVCLFLTITTPYPNRHARIRLVDRHWCIPARILVSSTGNSVVGSTTIKETRCFPSPHHLPWSIIKNFGGMSFSELTLTHAISRMCLWSYHTSHPLTTSVSV
jgi:hypothetical protein